MSADKLDSLLNTVYDSLPLHKSEITNSSENNIETTGEKKCTKAQGITVDFEGTNSANRDKDLGAGPHTVPACDLVGEVCTDKESDQLQV